MSWLRACGIINFVKKEKREVVHLLARWQTYRNEAHISLALFIPLFPRAACSFSMQV